MYKQSEVDVRFIFSHSYPYWNQVLSNPANVQTQEPLCFCGGVQCYKKVDWFMRRFKSCNGGGDRIGGWCQWGVGGYFLGWGVEGVDTVLYRWLRGEGDCGKSL